MPGPRPSGSPRVLRALLTLIAFVLQSMLVLAAAAQDGVDAGAGDDLDLQAINSALAHLQDVDTALSLAADGAALYEAQAVKLSGYVYCSQAVALAERGEFRSSVQAASMALHVALETGNEDLLGKSYRDLAIVFSYSGQLDRAEAFARLAIGKQAEDPHQVLGPSYKIIGDVRSRQQRYAEAIEAYEQALAGSSDRYRPLVQSSLVNARIKAGDLERARAELDALPMPADPSQRALLERTRGHLLLAEGRPGEALDLFRRLASEPIAGDEGNHRMWALDGVSLSEQALGNHAGAAQALERAIASFDEVRARFRSDEFKMGLFASFQDVFDRAIRLYSDAGDGERAFDISERSRARALLDAIADRGRRSSDTDAPPIAVSTLHVQLRPGERLIAYHSLEDELLAWVVSREGVTQHRIALKRADLARLVEAYRRSIITLHPAAVSAGDGIAALLLGPLDLEAGQRLVFIPHGPLHYLPFQSLRLDGAYLVERNPLSIAPSASIAMRLASRSAPAPATLLAFGNPLVDPAIADPLPGSEREVNTLSTLFRRPQVYMHADATRSRFETTAPTARIVHVAAHARADRADPLRSEILFADVDGRQQFLEARDVLELDLRGTSLVTLSACESGLGQVTNGDEVLGFTRSFLSAGASALVSSLWPVPDRETERLMTAFYRQLRSGDDVQASLRSGQLAVLSNPGTEHPFYWAAFNLIGDWRMTVTQ